jgi:hypothetical protein
MEQKSQRRVLPLNTGANAITGLTLTGTTPNVVTKTMPTYLWTFSIDGKNWKSLGTSGPHTVYFLYNTPASTPVYDLALEKGTNYANGELFITTVIDDICDGISADGGLEYDPGATSVILTPLNLYDPGKTGHCYHFAKLLQSLCESIGVLSLNEAATSVFFYGIETPPTAYTFRIDAGVGPSANDYGPDPVTMRLSCTASSQWPENPHFSWHAGMSVGSGYVWWDPVYGDHKLPSVSEHAPSAECIIQPSPMAAEHPTGWTGCPHSWNSGTP